MIDRDQAIAIARARAEERVWGFAEPVGVAQRKSWSGQPIRFEIETNAGCLGTKARFVVDATTGAILSGGYVPR